MKLYVRGPVFLLLTLCTCAQAMTASTDGSPSFPRLSSELGDAYARTEGDTLIVGTGAVERRWRWNGSGLATTSLRDLMTDREWASGATADERSWSYPGLMVADSEAELISLSADPSDDGGFTTEHLKVAAEIHYPRGHIVVQYIIWAYPGAPGFRTQVRMKAKPGYSPPPTESGRTEYVPMATADLRVRAIGYYNDTQHRNTRETEILREEAVGQGIVDWASVLSMADDEGGVLLVKESHKCVNQPGVDTGHFEVTGKGVAATGWGLLPHDLVTDRFRGPWANWSIVYSGGTAERSLALKVFDRYRYPIDPERDIYILANTWGSSSHKRSAQIQAREDNVLREIRSQADLGIDVQQIDDGWQGSGYETWRPIKRDRLTTKDAVYDDYKSETYPVYPDGWSTVRAAAAEQGVTLGLWAAWKISAEDLIWNHEQGGFRYFKIDFAKLRNLDLLEELTGKARKLIRASDHRVRINWDVTEKPPRVGYFFGREYGNIYLANRKPEKPENVIYKPYLVLRDAWQISKYLNLNKFQVTVQNLDRVDRARSDAWKHTHSYCVAQTLMGSPIFFQETHLYNEPARDQVRSLLALYRAHRAAMFKGYVFPVGDKPDNKSWSGWQNHDPQSGTGYLTVFRQMENTSTDWVIELNFLRNRTIRLSDLRLGDEKTVSLDGKAGLALSIDEPGDFLFYRYVTE